MIACEKIRPTSSKKRRTKAKKLTAISLFSGGGGLDIGMEKAGFKTLACIEIDSNCCETLRQNQKTYFKTAKIINSDVRQVDPFILMKSLKLNEGDLGVLYGGPPCQTFSQIGKMKGLNDLRGQLLFTMVEYAKVFRPKSVVIENVKALETAKDLNGKRGGIVIELISMLNALGYVCNRQVINSADHGVAQLRKRLFIVATKNTKYEFPNPRYELEDYLTAGEVLKGLRSPVQKGEEPTFANHIDVTPARDRERISYVAEGMPLAKMLEAPEEIRGRLSAKDTTKFLRLGRKKQSNTLRCGEIFFHPLEDRYLTPREYMRLHGFPDDYELHGPIRGRSGSVKSLDQHRQVANSVPPPVAEAIGAKLKIMLQ